MDDDEISHNSEGPWLNAKTFLLDLQEASNENSASTPVTDSPPSIPIEPPPFEIDLFKIDNLPGCEAHSISSSFDEWVSQEASGFATARHSDWFTPLELNLIEALVETTSKKNESSSEHNRFTMSAGKRYLLCVGAGSALACLLAVIAVSRGFNSSGSHSENPEPNKTTATEPSTKNESTMKSFISNHGTAFVHEAPTGMQRITIECQTGITIDATWKITPTHPAGFEILSIKTDKPHSILIARDSITQYLRAEK